MVSSRVVAVTGASGSVGGRVVRRLADSAGVDVVALAREPSRMPAVDGVEVRRADYGDPSSLRSALKGVSGLVFVSSDGEADLVLQHHMDVIAAASDCGVARVAYLSSLDADPASPFCYGRTNGLTERALNAVWDDVRILRSGLFIDFVHALMGDGDEVRVPPDGRFATVVRDEVADALAEAVMEDGGRRVRSVATAEVSWAELAAERGQRLVPVDLDTYRSELVAAGESPWWAYAYASLLQSIAEGRFALAEPPGR